MEIICSNWQIVAVFAAVLIAAFFVIKGSAKSRVFAMLYYGIIRAEVYFGSGTGAIKKAAAIAWVRNRLPAQLQWFVTDAMLEALLEKGVKKMKVMLKENANLPDLDSLFDCFDAYL